MSSSWECKPLGKICDVIAGQSPEGKYYNKEGKGLPFYQGKKEFSDKYIGEPTTWTTKVTKEAVAGDILMSVRAPVGPINFANEKICIGRGLAAIRARDGLDRDFLYYGLLSKQSEISGKDGAVFASINRSEISAIEFPVPPLKEQQRIVAILDETFKGIATATANAEKNLQNARELFESTLQSVFAKKGDGWETKKLEDIVEESCSLSYGIVQPGVDVDGGLPVVRPTDLTSKVIHLDGLKRIDPELATSYSRTTLQGGDLLLCVRGSTGTVSLAAKELSGANVTRGIVPIRFESTVMNNEFGYYQLISKFVQDQIKAGTYGAALMQINIRDLRKVEVKVPPLDVQKELTQKLDSLTDDVGRLESTYKEKLAALTELKQSILQKAFAGELH